MHRAWGRARSRLVGRILVLGCVGASLERCVIPDLDVAGKACPCLAGYVCNVKANRCERPQASGPDAAPSADGAPGGDSSVEGVITISNPQAPWTTSKNAFVTWTAGGPSIQFDRYELSIAANEAELLNRGPSFRTFGADASPEMKSFGGLNGDANADGGVTEGATILTGLLPDTAYAARVDVYDNAGGISRTPVFSFKTRPLTTSLAAVFVDTAVPDVGPRITLTSVNTYDGKGNCYRYDHLCDFDVCAGNMALRQLSVKVNMLREAFDGSFIEFAVAAATNKNEPQPAGSFTNLALTIYGADCAATGSATCRYTFPAFSFPTNGSYRVLQLPLRFFYKGKTPLSFDELQKQEFNLEILGLNGTWKNGTEVRLDEVRVRW